MAQRGIFQYFKELFQVPAKSTGVATSFQSSSVGRVRVSGNVRGGIRVQNQRVWIAGVEYKPGDPQPEGVEITWS